jgi:hypothetical protein
LNARKSTTNLSLIIGNKGSNEPWRPKVQKHCMQIEMVSATIDDTSDSQPTQQNNCLEIERAQPQSPQQPEIDFRGLALVFLAPALGGFVYGFDIGRYW